MIFLSYVALGALVFSIMMSLTFLNGLYFTIVTTLTIGFGDIVPITTAQRVTTCIYAVFGIIILGAAVRLTSEAVLEDIEIGYRHRLQNYKKRRRERKREREQVRRWRAAVEKRLVERGLEVWTPDKPLSASALYERPKPQRQGSTFNIRGPTFMTQPMRLNTEALSTEEQESAAQEAGVPLEDFIGRNFRRRARDQARENHRHHHQHSPADQGDLHHHGDHHDQSNHHDHHHHHQRPHQTGRSPRVPLEFTWTIDYSAVDEPQKTRVCGSAWWKRVSRALRLQKSGEAPADTQPEPSPSFTSVNLLKTLEREERRSLYNKVRLHILGNNTMANGSSFISSRYRGHCSSPSGL